MSWVQENKFIAGLAGGTALVGGLIAFFAVSQGGQYEEKVTEYQGLEAKYKKLQKSNPFPSSGNLRSRQENVAKYEALIKDVHQTFEGFKVGELKKLSSEKFGNRRVTMEKNLRDAFAKAGTTLPEDTAFGFERYVSSPARSEATSMLNYQLDVVQWLLGELAVAKPSEINTFLRTPLEIESGKVRAPEQPVSRKRGKKKKKSSKPPAPIKKAYTLMPMELAFTGNESSLREFLKSMVNSEKYFFAIRALRVRNTKQSAPNVKDAGFASRRPSRELPSTPSNEGDPFAGLLTPDGEGQPIEGGGDQGSVQNVEGARILKQVLGGEEVHVFIRFDVVFIKEEASPAKP